MNKFQYNIAFLSITTSIISRFVATWRNYFSIRFSRLVAKKRYFWSDLTCLAPSLCSLANRVASSGERGEVMAMTMTVGREKKKWKKRRSCTEWRKLSRRTPVFSGYDGTSERVSRLVTDCLAVVSDYANNTVTVNPILAWYTVQSSNGSYINTLLQGVWFEQGTRDTCIGVTGSG